MFRSYLAKERAWDPKVLPVADLGRDVVVVELRCWKQQQWMAVPPLEPRERTSERTSEKVGTREIIIIVSGRSKDDDSHSHLWTLAAP